MLYYDRIDVPDGIDINKKTNFRNDKIPKEGSRCIYL